MSLSAESIGSGPEEPSFLKEGIWLLWVRKGSVLAVVAVLVGLLLMQFSKEPKLYQSSTEILVRPLGKRPGALEIYESYANMEPARRMATSEVVRDRVEHLIGPLADSTVVAVEAPPNSNTLIFRVTAPEAETAQRTATAFGDAYLALRMEDLRADVKGAAAPLEAHIADLSQQIEAMQYRIAYAAETERPSLQTRFNALLSERQTLQSQHNDLTTPADDQVGRVLEPAKAPEAPIAPSRFKALAMALFLGGGAGVGQAILRSRLAPRVQGRSDLAAVLGAPVLAMVPNPRRKEKDTPGEWSHRSGRGQAYEMLRARITMMMASQQPGFRSLLVTSPRRDDGTISTAASLGIALSRAGKLVVLVSPAVHQPGIEAYFPGPHDSAEQPSGPLTGTHVEGLRILYGAPSGGSAPDLLEPSVMCRVIHELEAEADLVIIDAPPVLAGPETLAIAPLADAVLVVATPDRTSCADVREARSRLEHVGAQIVGAVLDGVGRAREQFERRFEHPAAGHPKADEPSRLLRDDWSLRL